MFYNTASLVGAGNKHWSLRHFFCLSITRERCRPLIPAKKHQMNVKSEFIGNSYASEPIQGLIIVLNYYNCNNNFFYFYPALHSVDSKIRTHK